MSDLVFHFQWKFFLAQNGRKTVSDYVVGGVGVRSKSAENCGDLEGAGTLCPPHSIIRELMETLMNTNKSANVTCL